MNGKILVLLGILVIAGGAFVYLDPMDLDLLGLKPPPATAKPAAPHVAPKGALPTPAKANAAVPSPAAPVAPKTAAIPVQEMAPAAPASTMPAPVPEPHAAAPGPAATAAHAVLQPPMKPSAMQSDETRKAAKPAARKTADKPVRPKNLDLRHCLDLGDDAAIAKCAGE